MVLSPWPGWSTPALNRQQEILRATCCCAALPEEQQLRIKEGSRPSVMVSVGTWAEELLDMTQDSMAAWLHPQAS